MLSTAKIVLGTYDLGPVRTGLKSGSDITVGDIMEVGVYTRGIIWVIIILVVLCWNLIHDVTFTQYNEEWYIDPNDYKNNNILKHSFLTNSKSVWLTDLEFEQDLLWLKLL